MRGAHRQVDDGVRVVVGEGMRPALPAVEHRRHEQLEREGEVDVGPHLPRILRGAEPRRDELELRPVDPLDDLFLQCGILQRFDGQRPEQRFEIG